MSIYFYLYSNKNMLRSVKSLSQPSNWFLYKPFIRLKQKNVLNVGWNGSQQAELGCCLQSVQASKSLFCPGGIRSQYDASLSVFSVIEKTNTEHNLTKPKQNLCAFGPVYATHTNSTKMINLKKPGLKIARSKQSFSIQYYYAPHTVEIRCYAGHNTKFLQAKHNKPKNKTTKKLALPILYKTNKMVNSLLFQALQADSAKPNVEHNNNYDKVVNNYPDVNKIKTQSAHWDEAPGLKTQKVSLADLLKLKAKAVVKKNLNFTKVVKEYNLDTYNRSNQDTCLTHKPAVKEGDWIQTGDLLADCASSVGGELSIGHNIIVAYMPWEGYNYEDAILINERLVYDDIYTSIHIERYEVLTKETQLGYEQITREIPDINKNDISHLDKNGIAKIGSWVEEGDILVGKVTPFNIKTLTPHQKLLYKIFNKELSKTKDSSLRAPRGIKANVININILGSNIGSHDRAKHDQMREHHDALHTGGEGQIKSKTPKNAGHKNEKKENQKKIKEIKKSKTTNIKHLHIYLAEKRKIQVGDKMAGRHGNKGIISRILPRQDMPFLPDGTCVDIVLNPLGVPSRMNVGQIYECLLGLAGLYLGEHYKIPPFDEKYGADASRSFVLSKLHDARKKTGLKWLLDPNNPGKIKIFDGRTSDVFDQTVTVGIAYILKLVHMVDDKLHMRSTGPYSLVTQQPLRGRSKQGGQRLGEMEVWAIEGYGAAFVLSEMLTIKSDDMVGRQNLWKNLIEHNDIPLGSPESFKVLVCELQALCLDIGLFRKNKIKQENASDSKTNATSFARQQNNYVSDTGGVGPQDGSASPNLIEIDSLLHLA